MVFEVHFIPPRRQIQVGLIFLQVIKESAGGGELQARVNDIRIHPALGDVQHGTRRAAAMIPNPVQVHHFTAIGGITGIHGRSVGGKIIRHLHGIRVVGIVMGNIGHQTASIRRFPPEEPVGKFRCVVPIDLLGHKVIHP